jgi:hypothetical protein
MKRIFAFLIVLTLALTLPAALQAQNVTEEEEAYLKEFDMNSFKDAGTKVKDSTYLYQHLIGVKWGYALSNVAFSQSASHKGFNTTKSYGIYYTYLHSMLGNLPFFGIQLGLESTEMGYTHVTKIDDIVTDEQEQRYSVADFQMLAIFRVDTKKLRFSLGAGGYLSYIYDTVLPQGIPSTTNKGGFGLIGQGGMAIKFHPIELHFEASYKYGLTEFLDPQIYSKDYWLYTHPNQLQFSVGVHYNLGGKYFKKK